MKLTVRQKIVRRLARIKTRMAYQWERPTHCWCGGELFRDMNSLDPSVSACSVCWTRALRHRLTEASYARWYASGDYRRYVMGTSGVAIGQVMKEIRRAAAAVKFLGDHGVAIRGTWVLDVGSGAGGWLLVAKLFGACRVVGVDVDDRSRAVPSEFGLSVLKARPQDGLWDRIICSHIIEHIIHPVEFLKDVRSVLGRNGCLYIETPAWGPKAEVKLPHPFYYSPDSLRLLATRAGLEVVAMTDGIQAVLRRLSS